MRTDKKQKLSKLRHWRVRKKINGTKERPRMSVCFTNEHIYVQFIDDVAGRTLASASTTEADCKGTKANVAGAKKLGAVAGRFGAFSLIFEHAGYGPQPRRPRRVRRSRCTGRSRRTWNSR